MAVQSVASSDEENAHSRDEPGRQTRLRDAHVVLDENIIFARATDYLHFDHPTEGVILRDLPRFDDSVRFGITLEDENANLREEIRRLVDFASRPGEPDLFNSHGALGVADLAGYSDLDAIAFQIHCAFDIIRHDNASLAIGHYMDETYYDILKDSRRYLRSHYMEIPTGTTGNLPRILVDEKRNMMAYHAVLDHVFHSLAWWIARVTVVRAFTNHYLAVLARWSVKLKCIALDPKRWAEDSLARAEDIARQISERQNSEDAIRLDLGKEDSHSEEKEKKLTFPNDVDIDARYYQEKTSFRSRLGRMLQDLLSSFGALRSPEGEPAVQVRTLLTRHGLEEELRHFTTHGNGTIETSSYLRDIRRAYPALRMLLAQSHKVSEANSGPTAQSSWPAQVQWSCTSPEGDVDEGILETDRLDDFVSLLTALHMAACADSIALMDKGLDRFAGTKREQGPPQPAHQLSVEDFPIIKVSLSARGQHPLVSWDTGDKFGVLAPSKTPFTTSAAVSEDTDDVSKSPKLVLQERVDEVLEAYRRRRTEIESWTVTQESVRVSTRRYSSVALAIAVGVIVGSVPLPFVVQDQLPGVDPFQLVMFSWLVVGAFLVAAKSRYVENWPWHDFLRMQVVCHSVSELAKAGRVDQQAVLLHLLFHEYRHPLIFSGPYPGVFRYQASSGGFNVDVPTEHATIMAAGFIVLEVMERMPASDQWEPRTLMQDTREGKDGMTLGFRMSEMAAEVGGKPRLVRVKSDDNDDDDPFWLNHQHRVIGVSSEDWNFT